MTRLLTTFAMAGAFGLTVAAAQSPAEMEKHIAAAKVAAGKEHAGLFDRVCSEARTVGQPRGGGAGLPVAAVAAEARLRHLHARRGTPSLRRSSTTCTTSG